jgi:hypothetical protein
MVAALAPIESKWSGAVPGFAVEKRKKRNSTLKAEADINVTIAGTPQKASRFLEIKAIVF